MVVESSKDHLLQQEEEEEEEALSLCDLPLDGDEYNEEPDNVAAIHNRRSSSDFFEFFSNLTSHQMSSAEDMIFSGKLVPFKSISPSPQIKSIHNSHSSDQIQGKRLSSFRRRSESLSALYSSGVSHSDSIKNTKLRSRNSRSLDYWTLERLHSFKTSSSESENSIDGNLSARSTGRSDTTVTKRTPAKPRWYALMFGVVKPPKQMELSDIKSRQVRRNSSGMMFPPSSAADTSNQKRPVSKGSSYRLFKVLTCSDITSVAVTASFCFPPPHDVEIYKEVGNYTCYGRTKGTGNSNRQYCPR